MSEPRTGEPPVELQWYMDTDFCEECGELLGYFGECPNCGWGSLDDQDDEDFTYFEDEENYPV